MDKAIYTVFLLLGSFGMLLQAIAPVSTTASKPGDIYDINSSVPAHFVPNDIFSERND